MRIEKGLWICPECNSGIMCSTGEYQATEPPRYWHCCTVCDHQCHLAGGAAYPDRLIWLAVRNHLAQEIMGGGKSLAEIRALIQAACRQADIPLTIDGETE